MDSNYPFLDFMQDYDERVGLWWFSSNGCGGHTSAVVNLPRSHCGTISFIRLLIAAQTGKLEELNVTGILKGVKQTQISEGSNAGEFLWYLEEKEIEDNHATFFNGLAMCALYGGHAGQFTEEQQTLIKKMLKASYPAFMRHVRHFNRCYPNEYLGDLVCAWLIGEWFGMPDDDRNILLDEFIKIGRLWHKKGWGWGEHLSDTYGCICIDELSMILLFSEKLSNKARESLYKLFCELLEIDDLFAGGPRVPAIRQYAFLSGPEGLHYRKLIKPVPQNATFKHYISAVGSRLPTCAVPLSVFSKEDECEESGNKVWLPMGATFYQCGWHEKLAIPQKRYSSSYYEINCINGRAQIYMDKNFRVGTTEYFPLMGQAEHLTWGLAWQSFPVAIWTCDKEWAYMQWQTREGNVRYCQPAEDKYVGRFNPSLTRAINPPVTGKTYSRVVGSDCFFVLRIMPSIVRDWQSLSDGFRIIGKSVACQQISNNGNWKQLKVAFVREELYLQCVQLIAPVQMMLDEKAEKNDINISDWRVLYPENELKHRRIIANLWVISRFKIEFPPEVSLSYGEMDIKSDERMLADVFWHLPEQNLHININLTDLCSPMEINENE